MLKPRVKSTIDNGIKVITMRGEFVGGNETDELRSALAKESESATPKLLIDLADVTYLNSTALGVLIAAHTNFTKRDATLGLSNVSKNIQNLFVITKLVQVFNVYGSLQEGLAAMNNGGEGGESK
jgi:anti-sigma B factor antagonist